MASKKAASLFMLVLIVCAGVIGYLTAQQTGATPPSKHAALIQKMSILVSNHPEISSYVYLDPKCVDVGTTTLAKYMTIFMPGKTYVQSIWIWQRYGDPELCMQVFGPGEDGETIGIEIAKISWDGFTVKLEGNTLLEIPAHSDQNPAAGYYDGLFVKVQ